MQLLLQRAKGSVLEWSSGRSPGPTGQQSRGGIRPAQTSTPPSENWRQLCMDIETAERRQSMGKTLSMLPNLWECLLWATLLAVLTSSIVGGKYCNISVFTHPLLNITMLCPPFLLLLFQLYFREINHHLYRRPHFNFQFFPTYSCIPSF